MAVLVVLGLIAGVVVAVVAGGSSKKAAKGEIFLQAAADPGRNPFGPSVATPLSPSSTAAIRRQAPSTQSAAGSPAITAVSGATPGLYGGSNRQSVCDTKQMISFLQANPDKAAAWAGVQGIAVSDLPDYLNGLTPVVLRSDTRVTNHGYANGQATAFQAILQAGTAVLIDDRGVPRARCACGNPLLPPVAVTSAPQYTGPPWPGFSPTNVTVINQSTTVINVITVINIDNGQPLNVPLTPGATPTSSPTSNPTPTSPTPAPSSAAPALDRGWRLKTVKFVPLLGQPDYSVSTPWTATGGGLRLTLHDDGTLCGGSGGTETVTYTWSFQRDITDLANGDTFGATANAVENSTSGTCNGGLAARSGAGVTGIGGGSLPLTAFDQTPQPDRIGGGTESAAANSGEAGKPTTTATLTVSSAANDPTRPEAGIQVIVQGPGIEFFVLYIYALN